jgi:N-methylhydantoinase B
MDATAPIDSITASVVQGALENIAVEMGYKLMRMSYSSIIRESEDFGAALVDATGRGLAESAQSTPLQSGPIPGYIRGMLRALAARGDMVRPGDVIMHNDAYGGASHGPDVGFAVPVFHDGSLVAFAATTAHHLDIGALSPGSCGIVDAIDAYAEGLQFKAIKVYDRGVRNDMVWQLLRDNIRVSDLVVGDMEAQIAAARIGAERLAALIERYGYDVFRAACEAVMDYAERLMRQAIAALPDGDYRAETTIDGFVDSSDPAKRHLPIVATVRVAGDEIEVDLTGTADQIPDRPINMPFEGTVDVAVWLTVRSVLLDTAVCGHIPVNDGLLRPIRITAPKGSLANPVFPAPTIARFCTGNAVADTVMKALAQALPGQVSAGIGNLKVIAFSGMRPGENGGDHWVHMEIFEGSYGGRSGLDGMDAVDTLYANTRNNPIEDIESHLPLRVTRYELREDACGAGEWRGGLGSVREFEYLAPGGASVEGEGHVFAPWPLAGGKSGQPAELRLVDRGGIARDLPSKVPHMQIRAGEKFVCLGPAGGGYGDPLARDPARVCDDVADGFVSAEAARSDYGVVLFAPGIVDDAATARLRDEMAAAPIAEGPISWKRLGRPRGVEPLTPRSGAVKLGGT